MMLNNAIHSSGIDGRYGYAQEPPACDCCGTLAPAIRTGGREQRFALWCRWCFDWCPDAYCKYLRLADATIDEVQAKIHRRVLLLGGVNCTCEGREDMEQACAFHMPEAKAVAS